MADPTIARDPRPWVFDEHHPSLAGLDPQIAANYLAGETDAVRALMSAATLDDAQTARVNAQTRALVTAIRNRQQHASGLDALLREYDLSSGEGIVLMCLAEALLRIPDSFTADRLIADKLGGADWQAHLGASDSLFVNASTWALLLTGRIVRSSEVAEGPSTFLARLIERLGEPVVRSALRHSMKILGQQFVMGETIEAALQRAADAPKFRYSFDMLGEAALTAADAERYFAAYRGAIEALGRSSSGGGENTENPSISVKLSALHPRYELAQGARALPQLVARLLALARSARAARIGLTVDAEEADRLELSLAIFARAFADPSLHGYSGLGIAVQAYQKRARYVLRWLNQLASGEAAGPTPRGIPVRLVKGAYWDSEIKRAQEQGLDDYPVFTQKSHTDVAYLACAKALLLEHEHLLPQFATHNAHTVAWISHVGAGRNFEFQRLHGMGEELYTELLEQPSF
jgi:RHH-type proline utilization regulon transcriptional repressor/proline dehydrogenase/delta 1-pyrroline-5-carboxylate dehydrogenase